MSNEAKIIVKVAVLQNDKLTFDQLNLPSCKCSTIFRILRLIVGLPLKSDQKTSTLFYQVRSIFLILKAGFEISYYFVLS